MKPDRIVYVSCNPASLARDIAILDKLGYAAKKVQPVDMSLKVNPVQDEDYGMDFDDGVLTEEEREELAAESEEENAKR